MACFLIAIVVFVIVAIVINQASAKHADSQWAVAAEQLRFRMSPSGFMQGRRLEGTIRGQWVCVNTFTRSSGKHSTTYTCYTVRFPEPLRLGMRVTKQGFLSPLMTLFGAQDIEVGDADFDRVAIVKGRDPERICDFLTPLRRQHIQRVLTASGECLIADDKIERIERGVQSNSVQLVAIVRELVNLAVHLSGESRDERVAAPVDAELSEPLEVVPVASVIPVLAEVESAPPRRVAPPPVPADEIVQVIPLREEPWPQTSAVPADTAAKAYETDTGPRVETPISSSIEPAPPIEPSPPTESALSVEAVCKDLFDPNLMMYQATTLFEQRYQHKAIQWSGTLRRANSYASDLTFGNQPGTKAVFDICEIEGGLLGPRLVQAVVQLAPEADTELRTREGERLTFAGRLLSCDGFTRNLFVADGRIV